MYLNKLSSEQKNLFLDLCINASNSNGEFTDEEKLYIKQYAAEMNITEHFETSADTDSLLESLKSVSNKAELKAIMIELVALLYGDNSFDDSEMAFAENAAEIFGISKEDLIKIETVVKELSVLYGELDSIICEE